VPAIDPHEGVTVPGSLAELDDVELHPYYGETAATKLLVTPPGNPVKHGLGLARISGSAPAVTFGAAAGTSPPAAVVAAGSADGRGSFTFGTGTTPTAPPNDLLVITFAVVYLVKPIVKLTFGNALTAADMGLRGLVSWVSLTAITVRLTLGAALGASQANTVYELQYEVTP